MSADQRRRHRDAAANPGQPGQGRRWTNASTGVIFKVSIGARNGHGRDPGDPQRDQDGSGESGKKVYAGPSRSTRSRYFLLAACDEVVAPPTAYIQFTGLARTSMPRQAGPGEAGHQGPRAQDQGLQVRRRVGHARRPLRTPAKENTEWIYDGMWASFVDALSADRGLGRGADPCADGAGSLQRRAGGGGRPARPVALLGRAGSGAEERGRRRTGHGLAGPLRRGRLVQAGPRRRQDDRRDSRPGNDRRTHERSQPAAGDHDGTRDHHRASSAARGWTRT